MNSENSTKGLVSGAVLSAITVVLYFISRYVPFFELIILLGGFIPLVLVFAKHGPKYALVSATVSAALIFVLIGPLYALTFLLTNFVVGMVLGFYTRKKESSIVVIGVLSICTLLATGLLIKLTTLISGVDVLARSVDNLIKSTEMSLSTLKQAGMGQVTDKINMADFKAYILIAIPGMALVGSAVSSCVYYIIGQKFLKRFKVNLEPIKEFSMWYIPAKIAYPVMLLMIGSMFLGTEELTPINYAIQTIFVMVFTINALSTTSYYLKKARFPKLLIALIVIMVFLMLQNMLLFIGLIEYALNIRGLDKKRVSMLLKK